MLFPLRRVILTLVWIHILLVGVIWKPANAQEVSQTRLAPINSDDFPHFSSYLDIRTPEGDFISNLSKQDVTIIEDSARLPVEEFEHLLAGVQLVLVVNPGPAFNIRDVNALSRYDYTSQALIEWGNARRTSSIDDLSLVMPGIPEISHTSEVEQWIAALNDFSPEDVIANPDFDILGRAIDLAADPTVKPGMGRAVLFVTSLPEQDVSLGLQNLAARANQQGVRIFTWLLASSELFNSPEAQQLAALSEQTGGQFFAYSGLEPIPFPEEYFKQLRNSYYLSYDSQITSSGQHSISAEVVQNGTRIRSPEQVLELEVMPPNITFVSPPMEIERAASETEGENPQVLLPDSQQLELLIEFPDGHPRSLEETSLLVDGLVVAANSEEPFNRFTWDLSEYTSAGEHVLQAGVEDTLGLTNTSMETRVQINIAKSPFSAMKIISGNKSLFAGVVVAVSGAILLLVLIIGGRLRPGFWKELRRRRKRSDPVTQPVPANSELQKSKKSTWINRFQWPQRRVATKPYAQFIPLGDADKQDTSPPIAITREKMTFGNDPQQVDQLLEDASVEGLHASLQREAEGVYRISDEGSTAGTWVNYTPVSRGGMRLEHGDLVHFGRAGFRFVMRDAKRVRKPVERPGEPIL